MLGIRNRRVRGVFWGSLGLAAVSLVVFGGLTGCQKDRSPDAGTSARETAAGSDGAGAADQTLTAEQVAELNRGAALLGQYKYAAASDAFAALAEQAPWFAPAQVNLAIAHLNEDQNGTRAEGVLRRVLEREPDNTAAQYCLGLVLLHGNRDEEARPYLEAAYKADPRDPYTTFLLARAYEAVSREEALQWYEKTVALDPLFKTAHYRLRDLYRLSGQAEKSAAALERFLVLTKCPIARIFDYKYSQMGSKATVQTYRKPAATALPAKGSLFQPFAPLGVGTEALRPAELAGITACDIDGDSRIDLFLNGVRGSEQGPVGVVLWHQPDGTFRPDTDHPLANVAHVSAVVWGDFNEDNRNDVYFCRDGANQMWWQKEEGRWEDVTAATGTAAGDGPTADAAAFDADHDGDLDLFVVQQQGANVLLNNNRDGTFTDISARATTGSTEGPFRAVLPVDLDQDLDLDLIVLRAQPPHELYRNDLNWTYQRVSGLDDFCQTPLLAAVAGDIDVDGQTDILTSGPEGLRRWRPEGWENWTSQAVDAGPATAASAAQLVLCDTDGDGQQELIVGGDSWRVLSLQEGAQNPIAVADGGPLAAWALAVLEPPRGPAVIGLPRDAGPLIWSPGERRHAFVALALTGKSSAEKRYRTNASGVGARAEICVGTQATVVNPLSAHSGPGQSLQPVAAGLAGAERADFVRIQWPDGIDQLELGLEAGLHEIEERDDLPSSCPLLFAWDGERFAFVSDLLAKGGLGYLVGPGVYATADPAERFLLPVGQPVERENRYVLKLTEPMPELTYLDRVGLTAYDLPPGWQTTLDERLSVAGPSPTGDPVFFRESWLPARGTNDRGEDVTELLRAVDQRAAPVGALDYRFWGKLAEEHQLVFEFERPLVTLGDRLVLVADGWVEFPFSQTSFAAWQAGERYSAPTLEVRDATGQWRPLLTEFGYPGGMPRQMSVPLDRAQLPAEATALRLRTNQEIYWDRLMLVRAEPCPEVVRHALALVQADVRESGFTPRIVGPQQLPHFDYDQRAPLAAVRDPAGYYTEFGPAGPLVESADNALAIFGPGEEIEVAFAVPSPCPTGWTRRLVLETVGWCKDMDLYTQHGGTVEPLPQTGARGTARDPLHPQYNTRYQEGR